MRIAKSPATRDDSSPSRYLSLMAIAAPKPGVSFAPRNHPRRNGCRHEVDFGDTPVHVELYGGGETIELFIEQISKPFPSRVGASPS